MSLKLDTFTQYMSIPKPLKPFYDKFEEIGGESGFRSMMGNTREDYSYIDQDEGSVSVTLGFNWVDGYGHYIDLFWSNGSTFSRRHFMFVAIQKNDFEYLMELDGISSEEETYLLQKLNAGEYIPINNKSLDEALVIFEAEIKKYLLTTEVE